MCLDTVSTIEGGGKGIGVARAVHRLRAKQKTMKRNFMVGDSLGGVAQRSAKQELHSELERSEDTFIPSSFHRRGFDCCSECHCGSHASFSEVAPRSSVAWTPSCRRDEFERSVAGREQIDITIDEVEFAQRDRSSPRMWIQRQYRQFNPHKQFALIHHPDLILAGGCIVGAPHMLRTQIV